MKTTDGDALRSFIGMFIFFKERVVNIVYLCLGFIRLSNSNNVTLCGVEHKIQIIEREKDRGGGERETM